MNHGPRTPAEHAADVTEEGIHERLEESPEDDGRLFVICNGCGASWSIHDAADSFGAAYLLAERIDQGDESCADRMDS